MNKKIKYISVEGVVLTNEPLSNIHLLKAVKDLKIKHFRGVFSTDALPRRKYDLECRILNLDDIRGEGTHQVAWFSNQNKKYYFDSYGVLLPIEIRNFLTSVIYNTEQEQTPDGVFCSHLCLYVLKRWLEGDHFLDTANNSH